MDKDKNEAIKKSCIKNYRNKLKWELNSLLLGLDGLLNIVNKASRNFFTLAQQLKMNIGPFD